MRKRRNRTGKRKVARRQVGARRRKAAPRLRRANPRKTSAIWGIVTRRGVIATGPKAKIKRQAQWVRRNFRGKLKIARVKPKK